MTIKECIKNLKVEDYFYVVLPDRKICIELEDYDKAVAYSKSFGGEVSEVFPYEQYGFEDPYTFTEEWTVLTNYGDTVSYEVGEDGIVKEVLTNGSF